MKRIGIGLLVGALLSSLAPPAVAQQEDIGGRYTITIVGARTFYDEASALKDTWSGGVEVEYNIKNWFGIGGYLRGARPTSDETFFPLVRLEFQDTVLFELVSQQVTEINYGAMLSVSAAVSNFLFKGIGGVGGYVINLDDQRIDTPDMIANQRKDSFSDLAWSIGGSVGYRFGRTGAVELRLRDFIYTGFDRDKLSVSEPLLSAPDVPHPREDIPEAKSTIHNINVELGFSFTLGGS